MRFFILLVSLAVMALPATALAAPAKISPRATTVSPAGRAAVEVANPNRYALRGTATVTVGNRGIAERPVRLPRRAVTSVALRFDDAGLTALRRADGRATVTLKLRRAGGRTTRSRRTVTFRVTAATPRAPAPASPVPPSSGGNDGGSNGAPAAPATPPAPPASDRWAGRMGTEGAYDDFELTVADGRLQLAQVPTVPVYCFENGGSYRSALSFELFGAPGPWTVGADESVTQQGIAVNQLVSAGERSITYKVTGTAQQGDRITGTLGMSFFDSRYDVFTNTITFINCSGAQSFEAVPAG